MAAMRVEHVVMIWLRLVSGLGAYDVGMAAVRIRVNISIRVRVRVRSSWCDDIATHLHGMHIIATMYS